MQSDARGLPGVTPAILSPQTIGIGAALLTVAIWGGWIVATRYSAETALGPIDIGLFRYGPPAILLAPIWWRVGLVPRNLSPGLLSLIIAGSGAPFLLVAATGMRFAPAAEIGALLPGTMPLWAALIGCWLKTAHISRTQWLGYGLIAAGIAAIAAADFHGLAGVTNQTAQSSSWIGHLSFIAAGALWAIYGHAFKRSGLTALQAAGIVAAWSFLLHLLLAIIFGTAIWQVGAQIWLPQLLIQGGLSGLVAIIAYGIAIRRLGATRAASFSALVPVLALLGGVVFLGETPQRTSLLATVSVTIGVALASHIRRQRISG